MLNWFHDSNNHSALHGSFPTQQDGKHIHHHISLTHQPTTQKCCCTKVRTSPTYLLVLDQHALLRAFIATQRVAQATMMRAAEQTELEPTQTTLVGHLWKDRGRIAATFFFTMWVFGRRAGAGRGWTSSPLAGTTFAAAVGRARAAHLLTRRCGLADGCVAALELVDSKQRNKDATQNSNKL